MVNSPLLTFNGLVYIRGKSSGTKKTQFHQEKKHETPKNLWFPVDVPLKPIET